MQLSLGPDLCRSQSLLYSTGAEMYTMDRLCSSALSTAVSDRVAPYTVAWMSQTSGIVNPLLQAGAVSVRKIC
jgi:hypothetical protein